jgi:hypothetical protein
MAVRGRRLDPGFPIALLAKEEPRLPFELLLVPLGPLTPLILRPSRLVGRKAREWLVPFRAGRFLASK